MKLLKVIFITIVGGVILWFIECMRQVKKF